LDRPYLVPVHMRGDSLSVNLRTVSRSIIGQIHILSISAHLRARSNSLGDFVALSPDALPLRRFDEVIPEIRMRN